MSGVLKLAEILPQTKLQMLSLANNQLCGKYDGVGSNYTADGMNALCEGLKGSAITSLSLDYNDLTNGGNDRSVVLKLAEVLPQTQLQSLR